jgi:putative transcriptional regulator
MKKEMFDELMESANQMAAHAAGEKVTGIREIVREVKPPRAISKDEIIKLRTKQLKVSQAAFALLLNTSAATVRSWEQGKNSPSGASLRLLAIARKSPKMLFVY